MVAEATVLGYACACTPYTDHLERRGKDFHAGTDRTRGMNDGRGGERSRRYQEELANPRGPVREYRLDRWVPPPTRPAVVLDPFGGTGTTALVANALGRTGLSFDLSHAYCRLARCRVFWLPGWKASGAALTAAPRPKPARPAPAGQTSLLFGASA